MTAIVNFYDPSINAPFDPYDKQSTLDKALSWSDRTLEYRHDFIQHWFPLPESSPVNPDAPIITKETRDSFLARPELRDGLRRTWLRMCTFYGFEPHQDSKSSHPNLRKASTFNDRAPDSWLTSRDHNHQRITRILRCLRILGLDSEAQTFYRALIDADKEEGNRVSQTSLQFWTRAAEDELYQPPDPRQPEVKWLRP